MKKFYFSAALAAVTLFWGIAVLAAGAMWVGSENATLKSEPKASAKTLSTLALGNKVSVLGSSNRWYRIRTSSGEEGWMYRGKLSDSPSFQGNRSIRQPVFVHAEQQYQRR